MSGSEEGARLIYIMTHYPKLAQTFIQTEINTLRAEQIEVIPVALNPPEFHDLKCNRSVELSSKTRYLKSNFAASIGSLIVATLARPFDMAKVWKSAVASAGGHPVRMLRRIAHLAHAAQVEHIARMRGVRHVHAHFGLAPATIGWFASAIAKTYGRDLRFSFTIHGFHDFADPYEARLDLKVPAATAVICVSDFTRSQLFLSTAPDGWHKCHVIRCGLELSEFSYRDPTPLPPQPSVVSLGRLSPEKGTAVLIDALALLLQRSLHVPKLRIIGDGPERGALEAMVYERGLADFVTFLGELSPTEVRAELAAADVFCMASFSEGLPVSLMEAMAVGTPCVTTWIAGIPELAEDGVTALAVPPARPDRLADAIARMLGDEHLRLSLARGARQRIEAQHDASKSAKLLIEVLFEERLS